MRSATLLTVIALSCLNAIAHDSPEHVVEALTHRMQHEGSSPALLVRRAYEYQSLGRYEKAEADLHNAIKSDPAFAEAYARLAHVFNAQGKYPQAEDTLAEGLEHAQSELDTVELLAIRAELHEANQNFHAALSDNEAVLEFRPNELDPLLHKSHLFAQMDKPAARVSWLRKAIERNPSIVLEIELTDALIDAKEYEDALDRVIQAANGRRWLSAWRIRRARIHLGLGEKVEAEKELRLALTEIDTRISKTWVDPMLLLESATAHALLGQTDPARDSLQSAIEAGASPRETRQVQILLGPDKR